MAISSAARRSSKKKRRTPGKCLFCEQGFEPDYKDTKVLKTFLTEKGKIVGRSRTGVCQKHQRKLATSVKRARNMALLPFVTTIS